MPLPLSFTVARGTPLPYGTSFLDDGINFSLFSPMATAVTLCLFYPENSELAAQISLDPIRNKTGDIWHVLIRHIPDNLLYAYSITTSDNPLSTQTLPSPAFLLDPYAKEVATANVWAYHFDPQEPQKSLYKPLGRITSKSAFQWDGVTPPRHALRDLVIYEMHVRGFTEHPSSEANYRGTFLGVIEKIPHLLDLGINAVELMPIQEFNEHEYQVCSLITKSRLFNYWGYATVNFFAPMNRYATSSDSEAAIIEFKTMVKELHRNGIEVILDVVFNHTSEGNEDGPIESFKGIANSVYYMLGPDGSYRNYSGCGNTFNANQPVVRELILECLRYWVLEMHVDGFRFDLASILTRGTDGVPLTNAPLIEAITQDPVLADVKLISEPWDAAGLYQVGRFYPQSDRWSEWNANYRDIVRRFIKGAPGMSSAFATCLCGSQDLYHSSSPDSSINFITSHDGFTLADLVSYNNKHNLANGEGNRDGNNNNDSWNCGVEGATFNTRVLALRERQMRNFHLALMLSQGVPMILMGDEYGHTKLGNNNTWCQDNDLNWFIWDKLECSRAFFRFYRLLIHFRRNTPGLRQGRFLTDKDIHWHGVKPFKPRWDTGNTFVAFTLPAANLYAAFNTADEPVTAELPPGSWRWLVNTANAPPHDIYEDDEGSDLNAPPVTESTITMPAHSSVLLGIREG